MIQMMLATIGEAPAASIARQQYAGMARKAMGLAIFASGLAVIASQALQRALGG
ncbi:MAG TPA: hypothetical protein VF534_30085 [Paraburkholderia sp.]